MPKMLVDLSSNDVFVVFIADACHAGKASGNIKGSEYVGNQLIQNWGPVVKILSCGPGEKSFEGPQWGGGRGAFSYHLVRGLQGLADRNKNKKVTIQELEAYLKETNMFG